MSTILRFLRPAALLLALAVPTGAAAGQGLPPALVPGPGGGWPLEWATPSEVGGVPIRAPRPARPQAEAAPDPPGIPAIPGVRVGAERGPRTGSGGLQGMLRIDIRF